MHSSTNFQAPPNAVDFLWSCDKVYHKHELCFLLYFLGQIVTWLWLTVAKLSITNNCFWEKKFFANFKIIACLEAWTIEINVLFLSVTSRMSISGRYKLTYAQGIARCNEIGLSVASVAQLIAARDQGLHYCVCGWLANGTSGFVLQHRDPCTGFPVVQGVMTEPCTWRGLQDVWCAYNWC